MKAFFELLALMTLFSSSSNNIAAAAASSSSPSCRQQESSSPRPIHHVLFVIAMEAEAMPFVEHLGLTNVTSDFFPSRTPFHAFRGSYRKNNNKKDDQKDYSVTVITSGKDYEAYGTGVDNCGTVPASVMTFWALQQQKDSNNKFDLVINAGTCGGFKRKGAEIGSVFLTTSVAYHDRRIPIPSFDEYGIGKIEVDDYVLQNWIKPFAKLNDYQMGACTTGNSLDKTEVDDKIMIEQNDASVKDMEAAAIGWTCKLYDVPFFGLKIVTDIVDGDRPTSEEFLENLHTASRSLQGALPKVLDFICGQNYVSSAADVCAGDTAASTAAQE